jgi:predicted RNA binding protein YcfA (HicA-like mRNA interferase family)
VVAALERHGYEVARQKGSHAFLVKKGGDPISVALHAGEDIPKGTLHRIIKDAGLSVEAFIRLLK